MGALSVTWDDHYRAPFEPLVPGGDVRGRRTIRRALAGRRRRRRPRPSSSSRSRAKAACARFRRRSPRPSPRRAGARARCSIADEVQSRLVAHRARSCTAARSGSRRTWWRSARRSAPACRLARCMLSERVADAVARRSRHDLRRQPAGVPRGAHVPRRRRRRASATMRRVSAAPVRSPPRAGRRAAAAPSRDVRGAGLIAGSS